MAWQVSVSSTPFGQNDTCWKRSFLSWHEQELLEKYPFQQVFRCAGYADYYAVIHRDEAIQINKRFMAMYADHQLKKLQELESLLLSAKSDIVILGVHEWESGGGD